MNLFILIHSDKQTNQIRRIIRLTTITRLPLFSLKIKVTVSFDRVADLEYKLQTVKNYMETSFYINPIRLDFKIKRVRFSSYTCTVRPSKLNYLNRVNNWSSCMTCCIGYKILLPPLISLTNQLSTY